MILAKVTGVLSPTEFNVLISGVDPRKIENYIGDQSPHVDDTVLLLQIGNNPDDLVAVSINDAVAKIAEAGEKRFYSYDSSGNVLANIYLNKDSEIVLNDGTDYAVKFNELKTQFDILKTDFNNHITAFTAHFHNIIEPTPGKPVTPPLTPGIPTAADISSAKVEMVRI